VELVGSTGKVMALVLAALAVAPEVGMDVAELFHMAELAEPAVLIMAELADKATLQAAAEAGVVVAAMGLMGHLAAQVAQQRQQLTPTCQ
jgi:hypothetical protein